MTNKILEAVKALGGDIANTAMYYGEVDGYIDFDDQYCVEARKFPTTVCSVEEFNTYAAEWLKEAYMHNAAIDLGWELEEKPRGAPTVVCTGICTKEELVAYMDANKPKPVFTQEMADAGELPPVGCDALHRRKGSSDWLKCKVIASHGIYVWINNIDKQSLPLVRVADIEFKPVSCGSPRDKFVEKLRKDLVSDDYPCNLLYDWIKQLTPEQRKEFGLCD